MALDERRNGGIYTIDRLLGVSVYCSIFSPLGVGFSSRSSLLSLLYLYDLFGLGSIVTSSYILTYFF